MEEITQHDPNPTTADPATPEPDPSSIRTTQPGLKRLFLTLSVLFSFILGFPLLWKSVEIYRSPLPFNEMDTLSNEIDSNPPSFPCHFQIILSNSDYNPLDLKSLILSKITKLTSGIPKCGSCVDNFTLSVTVDRGCTQSLDAKPDCLYKCGSIGAADLDFRDDHGVDEGLKSVLGDCDGFGGKIYSVVVVDEGDVEEVKAVVGKYRHAWIIGRELREEVVVESVAEIFVKVFVNGGRDEGHVSAEFMPVGADGRIVLSFSLLNSNPRDWVYDWDFKRADDTVLAPIVEALRPIANISVESQVLYHAPKSAFSSWNNKMEGYTFNTKDLPFFVNSNEWHLDTSIAAGGRTKILQFVVYVPSRRECPLLLELPNGRISSTNGFISPMWGGVTVWNPTSCSKGSESKARHMISAQNLEKVLEVFMGQLRQLFGLKSHGNYVGSSGKYKLLASGRGFTDWEVDMLSRQHTCFNLQSSAATLGSLSRLVQSLPRMIIMDEIGKQVKVSLEAARLAQSNASLGVYNASAVSSRQARTLAEDAFFHPSIMSVSYYSFEHCFAVYSPFFLPVSMHVILAALREWKRYKQEKAKYLLWKSKVKTAE